MLSAIILLVFGIQEPFLKSLNVDGLNYPINSDSVIVVEANHTRLSIELNALSGDSILYGSRLSGLDTSWFFSSYPVYNFFNLKGGVHHLETKVKKGDEELFGRSYTIDIKQAFWQKWWFWPSIALYIIIIAGILVYLFFLYDFRQKLKMQYVRNRIASDLHDEVGSNLNSIAIFAELLKKKSNISDDVMPILDRITSNSEETVSLMRDTVWAINPNNDSTVKLVERMRSFGSEVLAAKEVNFTFRFVDAIDRVHLTMEQRRNLYLIYKEAINNVAKHSQSRKAECSITLENQMLKVLVKDFGVGFDMSKTFEGNGLRNFELRNQEEDLLVKVSSNVGKGTEILIEVYF